MATLGRALALSVMILLAGCKPEARTASSFETRSGSAAAAIPTPSATAVTTASAARVRANEMGLIPVLEYHQIGPQEARWVRTPANFRKDMERLYREGYYLTSLHSIIDDRIAAPAGKTPVALTFDDASEGQFRYLPDGRLDPDCAVGMLEAFAKRHPDGGKAATFFVLPESLFGQPSTAKRKLEFLAANGYEIGNHTIRHDGLSALPAAKVDQEIGGAVDLIHRLMPGYAVRTLAYPYGMVPKDLAIVRRHHDAAFLVGSEPAVSPMSKNWKPLLIPRIQAIDSEWARHFDFLQKAPQYRYVSDGDPRLHAVPDKLPPGVEGTMASRYLTDPDVIRYGAMAS